MLTHIVMWKVMDEAAGATTAENLAKMREQILACASSDSRQAKQR